MFNEESQLLAMPEFANPIQDIVDKLNFLKDKLPKFIVEGHIFLEEMKALTGKNFASFM